MEYRKADGEFPKLTASAVTLGKFDGVHRGHKKLIEQILKRKEKGEQAVVVAFVSDKPMLMTKEERMAYLDSLGIDVLIECPLTQEFCSMTAEDFVSKILVDKLDMRFVAVGEDFRFGSKRAGTTALLEAMGEQWGYESVIVPKEMDGYRKVSSTYIREELSHGNMEKVKELLGRPFTVEGEILHGRGMGHKVFFPTANIVPSKMKLMPPNGVYATLSYFDDGVYKGISNVGYKPTVGETFLGVETYLYECDRDLYGKFCKVELLAYQRPEMKFDSFESLKAQIQSDVHNGELYFGELQKLKGNDK